MKLSLEGVGKLYSSKVWSLTRTPVFFLAVTAALAVFAIAGRKRQLPN